MTKEFYQDPTTEDEWVSVGLKANKVFKNNVSLSEIKKNNKLKNMMLIKISRLSVMPVTKDEYDTIVYLSE